MASPDLDRILADLRRYRESLTDSVDRLAETRDDRQALYREVERIRRRLGEDAEKNGTDRLRR